MATLTTVTMVDDIDGTAGAETVTFGLDGVSYEIDLGEKNAKKLRDAIANYIAHGRRTGGGRARSPRTSRARARTSPDREQTAAIREWARNEGYEVSDRGRLPAAIVEAFQDAH